MGNQKKERRGATFTLSNELFENMLCDYLGFEEGSLMVLHVTNAHYNRAVEISVASNDERFPVVQEGSMLQKLNPVIKVVRVDDESLKTVAKFSHFAEFES